MKYKFLNNEHIYMEIRNDLLYVKFKTEEINQSLAQNIVDLRLSFVEEQILPVVIDISSAKDVTKGARETLSSERAGQNISAAAIIVNNPVTRAIANFFLKFQQPGYPCKLFSSMEDAQEWLKKYHG